ncbi:MAG TPA: TonB-dependent receptor [Candidatus Binatia bacterium]|nr:TonB-dependent receptor [Candidatus Binatia bacterium]
MHRFRSRAEGDGSPTSGRRRAIARARRLGAAVALACGATTAIAAAAACWAAPSRAEEWEQACAAPSVAETEDAALVSEATPVPTSEKGLATTRLDPIVVTATRTRTFLSDAPQTITVLTREDIASREDATIPDVLRQVPGVDVVQNGTLGTVSSVSIRGSDDDQVLTLLDGIQINSGTLGAFDFANLVPEPFERIEVLRGGGGSLYGSEAVAGVVNLITRRPTAPGVATISGAGGNGDTDRETATFSGRQGEVGLAGAATHLGTAGFGPAVPVGEAGTVTKHNDAYDLTTAALQADWAPTDTGRLYAIGHYLRARVGLLNANNFLGVLDPNASQRDDFYFAKVGWEDAPLPGLSYKIDGAYVQDDSRFDDPPDAGNPVETRSSIPNEIAQADAQANYAYGGWSISTVGFQFTRRAANVSSFSSISVPPDTHFDVSRNDYGVYVQEQIHLFEDRLVAIGSFRHDHDTQFGDVTVPAASIAWRFPETATRLRATYAEGFRAPTFNELYFPNFGNPNLGPERSSEWDAGLDQELFTGRLLVSATYFDRRVKDDIVFVLVDPDTFKFLPQNVGRVDATGVETSAAVDVGHGLTLGGTYTYLGLQSAGGASPVLRRPNNRMAAFAMYDTPALVARDDAFRARVDVFFVGDRPDADPATGSFGTNPQYTRVDLALSYRLPWRVADVAFTAFANVSNLFDRSYEEVIGFPARPINALAGLRATF